MNRELASELRFGAGQSIVQYSLQRSSRVAHGPEGHAFGNDTVLSLRTAAGDDAIPTYAPRDCFPTRSLWTGVAAALRSDKSMSLVGENHRNFRLYGISPIIARA